MADIRTVTLLDGITYNLRDSRIDEGAAGAIVYPHTITLLSNNWTNFTQTVSVENVTADNNVMCTYAPEYKEPCTNADIYCIAQAEGNLTFKCATVPEEDIDINILVITHQEEPEPEPEPNIYGVYWSGDKNVSSMVRTDASADFADPNPVVGANDTTGSSPFDELEPWASMKRYNNIYLGTLVSIPKFWYKWTSVNIGSNYGLTLQIADRPVEGFSVSPAHMDRGDGHGERDVVYVGAYHCDSIGYQSKSGALPAKGMRRDAARSLIKSYGDYLYNSVFQEDFAMYWTIRMLYLVEYANWDSQSVIGYGCGSGGAVANNGATDVLQYHTGTTAESRSQSGFTLYRGIEGLWDNVREWIDGIRFDNMDVYVTLNPEEFSDTEGGTLVGTMSSNGWIIGYGTNEIEGYQFALFPLIGGGFDSTPLGTCDFAYTWSTGKILAVGGDYSAGQYMGLFAWFGDYAVDYTSGAVGCRLQYLPAS